MDLSPGSRISFVNKDGEMITEVIDSVRYESGSPAIYAELTWWQRMVRRLTPRRWRKPVPVVRVASTPTMRVSTVSPHWTQGDLLDLINQNIAAPAAEARRCGSHLDMYGL